MTFLMANFIGGILNNVTEASQPLKKLVEEVNVSTILKLYTRIPGGGGGFYEYHPVMICPCQGPADFDPWSS